MGNKRLGLIIGITFAVLLILPNISSARVNLVNSTTISVANTDFGNFTYTQVDFDILALDIANGSTSGSYANGSSAYRTDARDANAGPLWREQGSGTWTLGGNAAQADAHGFSWLSPFFVEISAEGDTNGDMEWISTYDAYGISKLNHTASDGNDYFGETFQDGIRNVGDAMFFAGNLTHTITVAQKNGQDITTNFGITAMKPGPTGSDWPLLMYLWNNTASISRGTGVAPRANIAGSSVWNTASRAGQGTLDYFGFSSKGTGVSDALLLFNLTITNSLSFTNTVGTAFSEGPLEINVIPNGSCWWEGWVNNSITNPGIGDFKYFKFMNASQCTVNRLYIENKSAGKDYQLLGWVNFTQSTNSSNTSMAFIGNESNAWTVWKTDQTADQEMYYRISPSLAPTVAPGDTSPDVITYSPDNNQLFHTTNYTVPLNFTATDDNQITNCSLWSNSTGTWHRNASNISSVLNNTNFTFPSDFVIDGIYTWNMQCQDNGINVSFADANRTFNLNLVPPSVTINFPSANNSVFTTGMTDIQFTYTDATDNLDAWLVVNGSVVATNTSVLNNTATNITYAFGAGHFRAYVIVSDGTANSTSDEMWFSLEEASLTLAFVHPTNTTYYNFTNYLEVSCTGTHISCPASDFNISHNNGGNVTYSGFTTVKHPFNTSAGLNTLLAYAIGSDGNTYSGSVNFTVDTICNATYVDSNKICIGTYLDYISVCTRLGKDIYEYPDYDLTFCAQGCLHGECNPEPSCVSKCQVGSRLCQDSVTLVYCDDDNADGCYEWSSKNQTKCQYGCLNDACATRINECTLGESQCSGEYLQYCDDDNDDGFTEWSLTNRSLCDYGCRTYLNETTNQTTSECNYHSFGDVYQVRGLFWKLSEDVNIMFGSPDPATDARNKGVFFSLFATIAGLGFGTVTQKWKVGALIFMGMIGLGTAIFWIPVYVGIPIIVIVAIGLMGMRDNDD